MLQDKTLIYFDNAAHDAASAEVDLQSAGVGKGEDVDIYFAGNAVTAAGAVTVALQSATAEGGTYRTEVTLTFANAAAVNAGSRICVPDNCQQWTQLVVTGTSGGTINGSVAWDSQTNI